MTFVPSITRSNTLCGCLCEYWTIFCPLNVPMAAPSTTSLPQWRLWYMRDKPTRVAPPYINGPTNFVDFGHHRPVSAVTAAAAANAVVVWPDGNELRFPSPNPPPNLKSAGLVSLETNGRARPSVPFRMVVTP